MSAAISGVLGSVAARERRENNATMNQASGKGPPRLQTSASFFVAGDGEARRTFSLRCWLFLEHPSSSGFARAWSAVVTFTILLSSCTFIIGTLPQYYNEGPHTKDLDGIEYYSIVVFTLEYVSRWLFFPVHAKIMEGCQAIFFDDPPCEKPFPIRAKEYILSRLRFMRKAMNLVDLMAILPFFIELILASVLGGAGDTNALAVIRVVRITRIFRLLKLGKNNDGMEILVQTMQASYSFLVSVLFLMMIITVLYASIVFFFETASNSCVSSWECEGSETTGADCTILCNFLDQENLEMTRDMQATMQAKQTIFMYQGQPKPIVPSGALIPGSSKGNATICGPMSTCTIVGNICYNEFGAVTNYNSIPNSMWWCLVTMCCVGFGDMAPVTVGGRIFGVFTALTGVIVLAMPTTVIGTNFSDIYESYYARKREEATDGVERGHETVNMSEERGLPDDLKGTNSKHLNRLIVEKQLAAQAKDKGIPQDVINLAFMSGDAVRSEREKAIFESVEGFKKEMNNEKIWLEVKEAARNASLDRMRAIIAKKSTKKAGASSESESRTSSASIH